MSENIRLKKFDMKSISDDSVICFIGKRNTGKSFLIRDLLYYHQDIPIGTIISATECVNHFYSNIFPSICIHDEYSPDIIENFINRQKKVIEKEIKDPRSILLMDDCMFDNAWTKDKEIRFMFMNGRHIKAMTILSLQYALGMPPGLRNNIDYIFILREPMLKNRKKLFEEFAGMFDNFNVFNKIMDECTQNYECLVIKNQTQSNKIEDQVFWYKAKEHEIFRIGSDKLWEINEKEFDKNYQKKDKLEKVHRGSKKKKVVSIIKDKH
jgi:hypothetical protein